MLDIADILVICGLAFLLWGVALVYPPAALILLGSFMLFAGYRSLR